MISVHGEARLGGGCVISTQKSMPFATGRGGAPWRNALISGQAAYSAALWGLEGEGHLPLHSHLECWYSLGTELGRASGCVTHSLWARFCFSGLRHET